MPSCQRRGLRRAFPCPHRERATKGKEVRVPPTRKKEWRKDVPSFVALPAGREYFRWPSMNARPPCNDGNNRGPPGNRWHQTRGTSAPVILHCAWRVALRRHGEPARFHEDCSTMLGRTILSRRLLARLRECGPRLPG